MPHMNFIRTGKRSLSKVGAKMKGSHLVILLLNLLTYEEILCDIYLHNPRGSNNRLNSRNTNRRNANRLFDSQNNNKGGYNVGEREPRPSNLERNQYNMEYLMSGPQADSQGGKGATYLDIEWTNQHGCGDGDLNCQIILQYMCQEYKENEIGRNDIANRKRNGQIENTPLYRKFHLPYPNKALKIADEKRFSSHSNYGLNEPWSWYDKCIKRHRNHGLFLADQNLQKKHTSIYTRQNPAGTRYGYECPEERDYYPYWHPTDWIDIAVLVDKRSDCPYYKKESFNVKPKGECMEKFNTGHFKHDSIYNTAADCTNHGGQWVNFHNYLEHDPSKKTKASCEAAGKKWVFAYRSDTYDYDHVTIKEKCVVPLKEPDCALAPYSRSNHLGNGNGITPLTYRWRLPHFPSGNEQKCFLRIRYNISTNDPLNKIKNNPTVKLFNKLPLRLAIDTSQFGRTFQDRSHMFKLTPRANKVPNDLDIYNVNIRGKRGNIVQVYPAVEYDFVPKRLTISPEDAIHMQWTGSNLNPQGNAGQGTAGTDRSNFVQMNNAPYSFPTPYGADMLKSATIVHNFVDISHAYQDVEASMASSGFYKTADQARTQKNLDDELKNASPSFAGIVMKWSDRKTFYYMCTRNNNFTNRSQKGRLTIKRKRG